MRLDLPGPDALELQRVAALQGVAYTYYAGVRAFGGPSYDSNDDPPLAG